MLFKGKKIPWYLDEMMVISKRFFSQVQEFLTPPFSNDQKVDWRLVALFFLINALVFYNVFVHDPRIGYDSKDHLDYLEVLSMGRLPDQADTREFFVPPLPYALGAIARAGLDISTYKAARISQVANGLISTALLFFLLKICLLINPRLSMRFGTLAAVGILPVYYRTFAFVRGEPYLAFFAVLVLYQALKLVWQNKWGLLPMIFLGISLGLCALSRQWGFFLFPSVGILFAWEFLRRPQARRAIARGVFAMFLAAGLIAGLFYPSLYLRYGTITAFNRPLDSKFSFSNQPQSFYLGLAPRLLFTQPVRPNYANQVWPILYSDTWGDYWAYFSIYGWDTRTSTYMSGMKLLENLAEGKKHGWLDTNYDPFSGYLGRVNLIALFPSLLVGCSIGSFLLRLVPRSRGDPWERKVLAFLLLAVVVSLAGYGWFWIQYPNNRGDTIKATYVLQLYPFIALLLGNWLAQVERKSARLYLFLITGLGLVTLHNLPTMVTHYILR